MKNLVLFSRVSSTNDRQSCERQISDLTTFANSRGYTIVKIFEEKISGVKKNKERKILQEMITFINNNDVDMVCVTEISRLGRNTIDVTETIDILTKNKISLYIHNFGMETLNDNKQLNPMMSLMITTLTEAAHMEHVLISERLKSGYKNYIKNGGKVGRKVGYRKSKEQMGVQYQEEIKY